MNKAKNQTVLITGGGTGIGLTLAKRFHKEGASVVICGRREEVLIKAAAEISATGERIMGVPADIGKEKDIVNLF